MFPWRLILAVLLGLLVAAWEVAVLPFLPVWLVLRPVIVVGAFLVFTMKREYWLAYAVTAGLVLDLYSLTDGSLAAIRMVLVFGLIDWLATRWITNRSFPAVFGLLLSARFVDLAVAWVFGQFLYRIHVAVLPVRWPEHLIALLVCDILSMSLVFGGMTLFRGWFFAARPRRGEVRYEPPLF